MAPRRAPGLRGEVRDAGIDLPRVGPFVGGACHWGFRDRCRSQGEPVRPPGRLVLVGRRLTGGGGGLGRDRPALGGGLAVPALDELDLVLGCRRLRGRSAAHPFVTVPSVGDVVPPVPQAVAISMPRVLTLVILDPHQRDRSTGSETRRAPLTSAESVARRDLRSGAISPAREHPRPLEAGGVLSVLRRR